MMPSRPSWFATIIAVPLPPNGSSTRHGTGGADLLTGREYGSEMTRAEEAQAKDAGLLVIFGASDDLVELRGVVHHEIGAWETFRVDSEGLQLTWDTVEKDDIDACREYFRREKCGRDVKAIWWGRDSWFWTFKTEIPHAVFEILEDGDLYCRGMVFALKDVGV
jgi:hypothetical protein